MAHPGRMKVRRRVVLTVPLLAAVAGCAAATGSPGAAKAAPTPSPTRSWTDEELVGQVLMPYAYGNDATVVSAASKAGNQRLGGVDTPAELLTKYKLGGLILVSFTADDPTAATNPTTNVESPAQVRKLIDGLRAAAGPLPPLVGTDQEYGVVTRIRDGVTQLPPAMGLGAANDLALTEAAWRMAGAELVALGVNVDFAPTADVTGGPENAVIGSRSFGADPALVSAHVAAAVRGLQASGVAAAPKHFPGHGHTAVDSHQGLPVLSQDRRSLDAQDLAPFRAAIGADTWMIMSGHLDTRAIDPGVPASLSHKVLTDVLRTELGFTGVVVSDALDMKALTLPPAELAVKALLAGNDLLLMPADLPAAHAGLLAALKSGALPRARLVEASGRVYALRQRLAEHARPPVTGDHQQLADRAAAAAVTLVVGNPVLHGPLRVTSSKGNESRVGWLAEALKSHGATVGETGTRIHLTGYGDTVEDLVPDAGVVVAMDTPYLLSSAVAPVKLASFGATRAAMAAVGAVLTGKAKATGRLPV